MADEAAGREPGAPKEDETRPGIMPAGQAEQSSPEGAVKPELDDSADAGSGDEEGGTGDAPRGKRSRQSEEVPGAATSSACRNHTGYIGVRKRTWGMFAAEIRDGSKRRWLGSFAQASEAGMAYDAALILQKQHRAKTNFMYDDFVTMPRPGAERVEAVRYDLVPKDIMEMYKGGGAAARSTLASQQRAAGMAQGPPGGDMNGAMGGLASQRGTRNAAQRARGGGGDDGMAGQAAGHHTVVLAQHMSPLGAHIHPAHPGADIMMGATDAGRMRQAMMGASMGATMVGLSPHQQQGTAFMQPGSPHFAGMFAGGATALEQSLAAAAASGSGLDPGQWWPSMGFVGTWGGPLVAQHQLAHDQNRGQEEERPTPKRRAAQQPGPGADHADEEGAAADGSRRAGRASDTARGRDGSRLAGSQSVAHPHHPVLAGLGGPGAMQGLMDMHAAHQANALSMQYALAGYAAAPGHLGGGEPRASDDGSEADGGGRVAGRDAGGDSASRAGAGKRGSGMRRGAGKDGGSDHGSPSLFLVDPAALGALPGAGWATASMLAGGASLVGFGTTADGMTFGLAGPRQVAASQPAGMRGGVPGRGGSGQGDKHHQHNQQRYQQEHQDGRHHPGPGQQGEAGRSPRRGGAGAQRGQLPPSGLVNMSPCIVYTPSHAGLQHGGAFPVQHVPSDTSEQHVLPPGMGQPPPTQSPLSSNSPYPSEAHVPGPVGAADGVAGGMVGPGAPAGGKAGTARGTMLIAPRQPGSPGMGDQLQEHLFDYVDHGGGLAAAVMPGMGPLGGPMFVPGSPGLPMHAAGLGMAGPGGFADLELPMGGPGGPRLGAAHPGAFTTTSFFPGGATAGGAAYMMPHGMGTQVGWAQDVYGMLDGLGGGAMPMRQGRATGVGAGTGVTRNKAQPVAAQPSVDM